jgi:2-amino-4-hydroxy-6-hydroxymethyldihydropteridine diphosphokinase
MPPSSPDSSRFAIALGGNVGHVATSFATALDDLSATPGLTVVRTSSFHETRPVGTPSDRRFLNGAAVVATTLDADSLLERMHEVEARLGRTRGQRWDDRPLDLDLILSQPVANASPRRALLPHPQFRFRRFVLDPLAEIAGDWIDPVTGTRVRDIRERLLPRPLGVGLVWPDRAERVEALQHDFEDSIRWEIAVTSEDLPVESAAPMAFVLDARIEWPPSPTEPVVCHRGVALARVVMCQTTPPAHPVDEGWVDLRVREMLAAALAKAM